ncbi:ATP-binding protein [Sunxiuqinia sp. sy24]|uniref:ATP-binding protein n=1 Tax=Sunxiuqinia sp. sy24 TaxID=3461495 RepID=UPI0040455C47
MFISDLISNVALLLVFSFFYELRWIDSIYSQKLLPKIFAGIIIGGIGIFLIYTPWTYQAGISFDFRSVLLSIAGLYLGAIPTLGAILIMSVFRFFLGGDHAFMGISLIISSGLFGIVCRYFLQKRGIKNTIGILYAFGLLVHLFMLIWLIWLPKEEFLPIVRFIAIPVIIIYPIITVLLGILMNRQLENWHNHKARERLLNSERKFVMMLEGINMIFVNLDLDKNIISCNKYMLQVTGYQEDELVGRNWIDTFVCEDEKEELVAAFQKFMDTDSVLHYYENKIQTKENEILDIAWHNMLITDDDGSVKSIASLGENITDKKAIFDKLKEAKEKAEGSNRLKSVFLQNVSHEIRTPMNGILGFINLLKERHVDEKTRSSYYDIINASGERLLKTVNGLIDIAKIETHQIHVHTSEVNVNKVLSEHVTGARPLAAKRNNQVIYDSKLLPPEVRLHTDRNLLESILSNLLSNAIKFTSDGTIEVGGKDNGSDIVFFVSDTGIGIPKGRLDAIFDRFVQADLNLTRRHEGTGLGLSIAKAYSHLLGGDLWVESEEGKGSTFFFKIPKYGESTLETVITETKNTEEFRKDDRKV